MLKRIRQLFAALFFTGITLLLLDVSGRLHHYLSWMPKVQLLPALLAANFAIVAAIIVLTLLLGRIYCSVICPLGVMQDLFARLGRHARHNRYRYSKAMWGLRVCVLIVFTVLTVAGITGIAALIAPYSTYGRIATHLFQPIWTGANNILALGAETVDSYAVSEADWVFYGWVPIAVTSLTLIIIGVLAWRGGRTWCNAICPVGTVLGATARFSLLKVHFNEKKCITCGKCSCNCKSSCIDFKNHSIDASRCVTCGNCISICPKDALSYGIAKKSADSWKTRRPEQASVPRGHSTSGRRSNGTGGEEGGRRTRFHRGQGGSQAPDTAHTSRKSLCPQYGNALHFVPALRV